MGNQLASRLRLLRKAKKLTQDQMAGAIQVPRVTYTHYELAKRTPDLDTIIQLARYHGVSVDFLVGNSLLQPTLEDWLRGANSQAAAGGSDSCYDLVGQTGALVADKPLTDD